MRKLIIFVGKFVVSLTTMDTRQYFDNYIKLLPFKRFLS